MDLIKKNARQLSFAEAQSQKEESLWNDLSGITVEKGVVAFLATFEKPLTQKNYASGLYQLVKVGLLDKEMSLQQFALLNHNDTVDSIKRVDQWSEATRQARAAFFISFTGFLDRRTGGIIKKAVPNREKGRKTFRKIRDKVATAALTEVEYKRFFETLCSFDEGACLIGKLLLNGNKRRNEVLSLAISQINWEENQIAFKQSKLDYEKEVVITFPEQIMKDLKDYVGERLAGDPEGKVFEGYHEMKLHRRFKKASKMCGIHVTPHMLRATSITVLKSKGYTYEQIQGMSGHESLQMVRKYDKTESANNISKEVNFF